MKNRIIFIVIFLICLSCGKRPAVNIWIQIDKDEPIREKVSVNLMMEEFVQNQSYNVNYDLSLGDTVFSKYRYIETLRQCSKIFIVDTLRVGVYNCNCYFLSERKVDDDCGKQLIEIRVMLLLIRLMSIL